MSKQFKDYWKTVTAKEADEYMDTLGIKMRQKTVDTSYAGAEPKSLLAEQDLETTKAISEVEVYKNGDKWVVAWIKDGKQLSESFPGKDMADEKANKLKQLTKSEGTFSVWYYDKTGARRCAVMPNILEAQGFVSDLMSMGYKKKDVEVIIKGQVEQTGKKLDELADKAEDADTKEEVKSLVNRIKATQIRRQKATIKERSQDEDTKNKSFKDVWNKKK